MNEIQKEKLIKSKDGLSSIRLRMMAPSSLFWKRMLITMMSCTGLGVGLATIPSVLLAIPNITFEVPEHLYWVASILMAIGVVGSFLSKLTVDWSKIK